MQVWLLLRTLYFRRLGLGEPRRKSREPMFVAVDYRLESFIPSAKNGSKHFVVRCSDQGGIIMFLLPHIHNVDLELLCQYIDYISKISESERNEVPSRRKQSLLAYVVGRIGRKDLKHYYEN